MPESADSLSGRRSPRLVLVVVGRLDLYLARALFHWDLRRDRQKSGAESRGLHDRSLLIGVASSCGAPKIGSVVFLVFRDILVS